jgi:hypothetical protein
MSKVAFATARSPPAFEGQHQLHKRQQEACAVFERPSALNIKERESATARSLPAFEGLFVEIDKALG